MQEKTLAFRMTLVAEEFQELAKAALDLQPWIIAKAVDPLSVRHDEFTILQEAFLKELIDCVYVLVGTAVQFDWDFEEAFKLVHESNMSKLNNKPEYEESDDLGGYRKVQKSDTYQPPNLEECL